MEHVLVEEAALRGTLRQVKDYDAVDKFVGYLRGSHLRRPILAIIGGTNLGKSLLAAEVLRKVGVVLGLTAFLEITAELTSAATQGFFSMAWATL